MKEKSDFKKPKLPKHFIISGESYGSRSFFLIYLHKKLTEQYQKKDNATKRNHKKKNEVKKE